MKYYFIYSAGGGAGDWNGIKRIWNDSMPVSLKSKILLKFGDVFLNHRSNSGIIRPQRWEGIGNLRTWLFENVNDEYVLSDSEILLDSGTAKIVSYISYNNDTIEPDELLSEFNEVVENNNILQKYVDIIVDSNINYAVTFDVPNPFKVRSQSTNTRTSVISEGYNNLFVEASADYSNSLYSMLADRVGIEQAEKIIFTTINGAWNIDEFNRFLELLDYEPKKLAIGGLTRKFKANIPNLLNMNLHEYEQVHFLGCGGIKNVSYIKDNNLDNANFSVDVSTPLNRAIDGSVTGKSQSGYFQYDTAKLHRIKPSTKNSILEIHNRSESNLFDEEQMEDILNKILLHQSNNSSRETYNARAKLILHNSDVFRKHAQ